MPGAFPAARPASWPGLADWREDLRPAVLAVGVLGSCGLLAGLLWWRLAPRADFTVTANGPVPVGSVSQELLVSDDVVYLLLMAGLGVLAGMGTWLVRRRRGVPALVALAAGTLLASIVAWQLGELLGRAPSAADLSEVGRTLTTGVDLAAVAALAVAPFLAVLVYLLATVFAADDDLARTGDPAHPHADGALTAPVPGSGLDAPATGPRHG